MSTNSRFLFDNEFESSNTAKKVQEEKPVVAPPIYTEEQYQAALGDAFEEGRLQGEQAASAEKEMAANNLLENINQQVQQLNDSQSSAHSIVKRDAAEIAFLCAQKIASSLLEQSAEKEVFKLVENCLADMIDEPRVVVRASEPVCESLKDRIDALTASSGFQGQLILLPDDTKTGANCRIEWADGGVEKDIAEITEKISEIVNRYMGSLITPASNRN